MVKGDVTGCLDKGGIWGGQQVVSILGRRASSIEKILGPEFSRADHFCLPCIFVQSFLAASAASNM
jgi:hypothetical protein